VSAVVLGDDRGRRVCRTRLDIVEASTSCEMRGNPIENRRVDRAAVA
jgi:hypothetical protein